MTSAGVANEKIAKREISKLLLLVREVSDHHLVILNGRRKKIFCSFESFIESVKGFIKSYNFQKLTQWTLFLPMSHFLYRKSVNDESFKDRLLLLLLFILLIDLDWLSW